MGYLILCGIIFTMQRRLLLAGRIYKMMPAVDIRLLQDYFAALARGLSNVPENHL